jgi:hypothetical protein
MYYYRLQINWVFLQKKKIIPSQWQRINPMIKYYDIASYQCLLIHTQKKYIIIRSGSKYVSTFDWSLSFATRKHLEIEAPFCLLISWQLGRIRKEEITMHITCTDASSHSCGYGEFNLLGNNAVYSKERLNRRFGGTYRLQLKNLRSMPSSCLVSCLECFSTLNVKAMWSSKTLTSTDLHNVITHVIPTPV